MPLSGGWASRTAALRTSVPSAVPPFLTLTGDMGSLVRKFSVPMEAGMWVHLLLYSSMFPLPGLACVHP